MNKRIYETMHLSDDKVQQLLFILILILGVSARLWMFVDVPGGINQDEHLLHGKPGPCCITERTPSDTPVPCI